ncbi:hypothetical protein [Streptomyces olivaceoviridis]|uniref:hypothetical protein n=1 Tax=Streptomyces olivaceoviridis TaxID=1921 RepID=UPI0036975611
MRARSVLTGLAATCLTLTGVLGVAGTASADDGECEEIKGGYACWYHYGDIFSVLDTEPDGAHAEVTWQTWGRSGTCKSIGYGNYNECNYDLPEGKTLSWAISIWDGNLFVRKSPTYITCTSEACI